MVKDKPYKYGAASSMGTQEEYFKNIKPNINSKTMRGPHGAPSVPPPTRELKYF